MDLNPYIDRYKNKNSQRPFYNPKMALILCSPKGRRFVGPYDLKQTGALFHFHSKSQKGYQLKSNTLVVIRWRKTVKHPNIKSSWSKRHRSTPAVWRAATAHRRSSTMWYWQDTRQGLGWSSSHGNGCRTIPQCGRSTQMATTMMPPRPLWSRTSPPAPCTPSSVEKIEPQGVVLASA